MLLIDQTTSSDHNVSFFDFFTSIPSIRPFIFLVLTSNVRSIFLFPFEIFNIASIRNFAFNLYSLVLFSGTIVSHSVFHLLCVVTTLHFFLIFSKFQTDQLTAESHVRTNFYVEETQLIMRKPERKQESFGFVYTIKTTSVTLKRLTILLPEKTMPRTTNAVLHLAFSMSPGTKFLSYVLILYFTQTFVCFLGFRSLI